MNNFAEITLVQRYKKVVYYSLTLNEDEQSMFDQFMEKQSSENKTKMNHILAWLKVIGNKIGAQRHYFRNEAEISDVSALPPKGIDRAPAYVEYNEFTKRHENKPNDLRLYCLRANEHVVFLFSGDVKTRDKAQDCHYVRPHFKMANMLTKSLDKAFRDQDITWNINQTDIVFEPHFRLNW